MLLEVIVAQGRGPPPDVRPRLGLWSKVKVLEDLNLDLHYPLPSPRHPASTLYPNDFTSLNINSGLNVAVTPTDKKASNNKAFRFKKHRLT